MAATDARPSLRNAWHMQDAYGWVFLLLLADITLLIILPSSRWAKVMQVAFVGLTLILALRTSDLPRARWGKGAIVAAVALGLTIVIALLNLQRGGAFTALIIAGLLAWTAIVILRRVLTQSHVTARALVGALCVYLIIGLFFAFVFLAVAEFGDGPFFAQVANPGPSDLVYFSYITMLTIGYGDLAPMAEAGRLLAIMDGLLGQVFLVTTVARLVALYGGFQRPPEKDESSSAATPDAADAPEDA